MNLLFTCASKRSMIYEIKMIHDKIKYYTTCLPQAVAHFSKESSLCIFGFLSSSYASKA